PLTIIQFFSVSDMLSHRKDIILINDASARRGMTMAGAAVNVLAINTASSPVTNTTANPSLTHTPRPPPGLKPSPSPPISNCSCLL
ncbi:hypothetical protein KUCAC02_011576, partial [Chaenocephalus aceratus]